jgi:hypothetical protein
MARQGGNLAGLRIGLVLLTAAVLTTGCSNPTKQMRERIFSLSDTRLKTVLQQSLAVSGGLEAWGRLDQIDGQAITTVHEPEGNQALIEQQCRFLPDKKIGVSVTSHEPTGTLTEMLDRKGNPHIYLQGLADTQYETNREKLYGAAIKLRVLAQAMTGPAGLLAEDLELRYVGPERKGGRMMHKIEVTGALLPSPSDDEYQGGNLLVVWIDSQTHQISRLWLRYYQRDKNFGYLALNIGIYENVPGGFLLPTYISYSHSDRHQQFSEQQMMTVEFQELQTVLRDKDRKWFYE